VLLVGAILLAIFVLPEPWRIPVVAVAAVIEVAETLFWLWYSRRGRVKMGPETLLGMEARVVVPLAPVGQVRVHGELWQARCEEGAEPGERVLVRGLDGLTLLVDRAEPHEVRG
jgi:membrane-bound serine protease (ClpP class)